MCYTYKASILFFSLLLLPPFFANAQADITAPNTTASTTINPTLKFNEAPTLSTGNDSILYYHPISINHFVINIHDITSSLCKKIQETISPKNYQQLKSLIKKMLWERRYAIAGGSLIGSYSSISLLLMLDYNYLQDSSLWSRWKPDYTFADLCAIPEKELEKELVQNIAQRNFNKKNPTDIIHPLINFINTIDTEIYRIKRYIKTALTIKKLRLITVFPTNDTKITRAQQLLERALFIRHIFLSWLAEYNLTSK